MKTLESIREAIKAGRQSGCLDRRDYGRLLDFFPTDDWSILGFTIRDKDAAMPPPQPFTQDAVLALLEADVAFGFEQALNQRGISSALMYEVVKMWLWILDDDLQYLDEYAMYGLPLFKAVALKYGFPNAIGDDAGSEDKYETN